MRQLAMGDTPAEWKAMLDIDILSLVNLIEAAQPYLETAAAENGDAAFVAIRPVRSGA
jgi:hypothetical protein